MTEADRKALEALGPRGHLNNGAPSDASLVRYRNNELAWSSATACGETAYVLDVSDVDDDLATYWNY